MSTADLRAQLAEANASAAAHPAPIRQHPDPHEGVAAWQVGTLIILMPALADEAPPRLHALYQDRILANALGRCPRCDAVAGVTSSTTVGLAHEPSCPLSKWWSPEDAALLDPQGVAALAALTFRNIHDDRPRLR